MKAFTPQTIQENFEQLLAILAQRYDTREASNIARIVFEDAFGIRNVQRQDLFNEAEQSKWSRIVERLQKGEPLQYVLGEADFYGLKFKVSPAVLIPRPETEELVYLILETLAEKDTPANLKLLDIGTGTGCIPLTLKSKRSHWELTGIDVSPAALAIAQTNAENLNLEVDFLQCDILEKATWPADSYDAIGSNPPYIPPSEKKHMPAQVLEHEPALALFVPEENALLFYAQIILFALQKLRPNGYLFFECNEFNAKEVLALARAADWNKRELHSDMSGKDRLVVLQKRN